MHVYFHFHGHRYLDTHAHTTILPECIHVFVKSRRHARVCEERPKHERTHAPHLHAVTVSIPMSRPKKSKDQDTDVTAEEEQGQRIVATGSRLACAQDSGSLVHGLARLACARVPDHHVTIM